MAEEHDRSLAWRVGGPQEAFSYESCEDRAGMIGHSSGAPPTDVRRKGRIKQRPTRVACMCLGIEADP